MKKILLVAGGLVAVVIILEIALQLYSLVLVKKQRPILDRRKNICRVLCLGDSYTYGIGAEFQYSYPAQLDNLLAQNYPTRKFEVINEGLPGINTPILALDFENKLKEYDPDIVIVMIGANDQWNFEGFSLSENRIKKLFDKYFQWSKLFKLIKISAHNFQQQRLVSLSQAQGSTLNKNYKYHEYIFMKANMLRADKNFAQANKYYDWLQAHSHNKGLVDLEKARCCRLAIKYENTQPHQQDGELLKINRDLSEQALSLLDKAAVSKKLNPEIAQDIRDLTDLLLKLLSGMVQKYSEETNPSQKEYLWNEIAWMDKFIYKLIKYERVQGYTVSQQTEKILELSRIFSKTKKAKTTDAIETSAGFFAERERLLKEANVLGLEPEIMQKEIISITRKLKDKSFYAESLLLLDEALKLQENKKEIFNELDGIFINWGKPERTIAYYKYLLNFFPRDAEIYLRLGRVYKMLKDFRKAKQYYEQAYKLNDQNQEAHRAIKDADFFITNRLSVDSSGQLNFVQIDEFINWLKSKKKSTANDLELKRLNVCGGETVGFRKINSQTLPGKDLINAQTLTISSGKNHDCNYTLDYLNSKKLFQTTAFSMLRRIYEDCQKKGVRLIFLGYPATTPAYVQEAAQTYSISFLDSRKEFLKLITPENIKDYFIQDGHCTAKGYGVIAKIVFDRILAMQEL